MEDQTLSRCRMELCGKLSLSFHRNDTPLEFALYILRERNFIFVVVFAAVICYSGFSNNCVSVLDESQKILRCVSQSSSFSSDALAVTLRESASQLCLAPEAPEHSLTRMT